MASEDAANIARLREEWEMARLSMDVCSKANNHLMENMSTVDTYTMDDAVEFMVSTDGKTIDDRDRQLGWEPRQVGGILSEASLQQLSRDMTSVTNSNSRKEIPPSRDDTQSGLDNKEENGPTSDFQGRFGQGSQITS